MKTLSILITSYLRPQLLRWNLHSLARQKLPFAFETILLNDGLPDESEDLSNQYREQLNLTYVFTGHRNIRGNMIYRVPGFAVNIGVRLAQGEIIIISCAEMFHINDTVRYLVEPVLFDPHIIATSIGMDDDGSFLASLESNNGWYNWWDYCSKYKRLNTRLPFLMAMHKDRFMEIGGYDEDMVGFAFDDNDLMDRLLANGSRLCLTQAQTIHLYHPRHDDSHIDTDEYRHNSLIYQQRKGKLVRNQGREWGYLKVDGEDSLSLIRSGLKLDKSSF